MGTPFTELLHATTQGLLVPVLLLLFGTTVYAAYQGGIFVTEWWRMSALNPESPPRDGALARRWESAFGARGQMETGERAVEAEELRLARRLSKTDVLARLAPALGLAGTLIPLGPGLSALGRGDLQVLAESLTVAFDTTILGLAVGAVAFLISSVRRRWYEGYVLTMTSFHEQHRRRAAATGG